MASRDLTNTYFDRRATALKRRNALGSPTRNGLGEVSLNGNKKKSNRLTAGGSRTDDDDGHSLMLMEVRFTFAMCAVW
jgi:hypothetical protein